MFEEHGRFAELGYATEVQTSRLPMSKLSETSNT